MDVPVRIIATGRGISVGDSRAVGVSDLWRLSEHEFCGCATADVLLEGFFDVRPNGDAVEVRATGRCITCGERGSISWLTVDRIENDRFIPADPSRGHRVTSA